MFPAFTKHSFSGKLSLCLLVNVAFIYGLEVMAEHEVLYRTLTLSNVFERISPKAQLSLGIVMVMLIIDTIIYMLVALYVEAVFPGEYGLSRVWYFPFTSNFWWPKPRTSPERTYKSFIHEAHYCEPEPDNRKIGIQLLHLKKKYGKSRVVLRDLTCNMFEGEVTVLLGHNGAGKTTTMSILTGVISPTDGSAIVNGYDIRTDMKIIRKSLGFCAQENILFGLLTVTEHLDFYCRLRGLQGQRLKDEIRTYLHLLGLMEKRRTKSKNLSGGMKRKLCVGIALCGNPKVCILDEPTSGMDPTSRRQLWDIIQMKKTGRTILLSTHFMNEADILGDRVAILGSGMLQCYGSSFYLKKVESEVGTELTYILPDSKANMFEMMLDDLENRIDSLGIQSYGISLATLEEVFMRVGVEHDFDEHILTSISDEGFLGNVLREYRTGFALYINQILAMAMKKALVTLRGWLLFIVHILLPIVLTIVLMHTLTAVEVMQSSPNLGFTLDSYNSPITVITTSDENNLYYNRYKQILQNEKREIIDWRREDMNHRMIKKTREDTEQVRMRFIIGATFLSNNTIVAWFNNEPFHSPPLALQIGNYVIYKFSSLITKAPQEDGTEDVDVLEEKRLIHSDQIEPTVYPVRLKDLTKYYNRNLIVNQLCLRLKQGECFGLLGVNGAGKTTTFKMMTGEIRMSYGNGWICGWDLKSNVKNAHRCIGYCPQFDALLDNLTVKETLIMYCLIRGIPPHNCESTVYNLAKDFVFNKHMRKKICHLSGGNKRKVSTAIALIGEPLVIFLDEPSTGMDPNMKRHFWNKLCTMRNLGKCLILTTHSMDECEAVCTRVAIMANGAFQCLGSIQHLKNKFSDGYVLIIKVRKTTDELQLQANVTHVDNFVKMNFSGSELREKHDMLLTYVIKSTDISWSKIFGIMEQGKEIVQEIEDYSLSQFDLEQVNS
ncbi:hypothetical protein Trydic_g7579 [Trypoxylus dichotomus]